MRDQIRKLVIEAITDTEKLTEVVDKLCVLCNVSLREKSLDWWDMLDSEQRKLMSFSCFGYGSDRLTETPDRDTIQEVYEYHNQD